jgi:preprotein translocase subunit SecG
MELLKHALPFIQIGLSVLLSGVILLQQSAAGLGAALGGGDAGGFHTRRGFEKTLFNATIVIGIVFAASSLAALVLK